MPYTLRRNVLASTGSIRLKAAEYSAIKVARAWLTHMIGIEETYDSLMENYVEFEQTILALSMNLIAFVDVDYRDFQRPRNTLSRKLGNLLSSCRLYRDSIPRTVSAMRGSKSNEFAAVKNAFKDSAKQPMSFRIMEAVRNYAQHQDFVVSGYGTSRRREDTSEKYSFAHSVAPVIDGVTISKTRGLHPDVKKALQQLGDAANPVHIIREYVEHIGAIHADLRGLLKVHSEKNEAVLKVSIARYKRKYPRESHIGLFAGVLHPNNTTTEQQFVVKDALDYLAFLRTKNLSAKNLSRRFVKWEQPH